VRSVDIEGAAEILRAGGIVAFPTETVYGLGADADRPASVARIFEAKGRPSTHPLIVHLPSVDAIDGWASPLPPAARRLADLLWPGPLTLVLPRGPRANDAVTGGLPTIGIRVPAHPVARALLERFGGAIAAPSANRFGAVSPTRAEHVRRDLADRIDGLIDAGSTDIGIESTIVDVSRGAPEILRPGAISRETLEDILGAPVPLARDASGRAPGTLASHYAPRARVLAVSEAELATVGADWAAAHSGDRLAVLAPPEVETAIAGADRIDVPSDPTARARTLYASLRAVDEGGYARAIAVLPSDERGLGLAIADRLRRAAGPR
jgi:L-threonylcarbamoyladenylate synthase